MKKILEEIKNKRLTALIQAIRQHPDLSVVVKDIAICEAIYKMEVDSWKETAYYAVDPKTELTNIFTWKPTDKIQWGGMNYILMFQTSKDNKMSLHLYQDYLHYVCPGNPIIYDAKSK